MGKGDQGGGNSDQLIVQVAKSKDTIGLAPPVRLEVLGENEQAPAGPPKDTTAVVVFHGMGQQVKFETVDMLAQALIDAHEAGGGRSEKRVRHAWCDDREGGRFIPRVEIELQDARGIAQRSVHVYESYWAPLTEGAISFFSTVSFFLRAGLRGICASRNDESKFLRWAFGRERAFPLARGTYVSLIVATLLLALLVAALVGGGYWLWPAELKGSMSLDAILKAGFSTLLWAAALYVTGRARHWMVQYPGRRGDLFKLERARQVLATEGRDQARVLPGAQCRVSGRRRRRGQGQAVSV